MMRGPKGPGGLHGPGGMKGRPGAKNPGKTFKRIIHEVMKRYKFHYLLVEPDLSRIFLTFSQSGF